MSGFHLDLSIDALDKLSFVQIRYMLEEINHSVGHLERSQLELLEALVQEEDSELSEAYWDNVKVLEKKKEQVITITKYLDENDMAFYRHHHGTIEAISVVPSAPEEVAIVVEATASLSLQPENTEDNEEDEDLSTEALIRSQQTASIGHTGNHPTTSESADNSDGIYL